MFEFPLTSERERALFNDEVPSRETALRDLVDRRKLLAIRDITKLDESVRLRMRPDTSSQDPAGKGRACHHFRVTWIVFAIACITYIAVGKYSVT